MDYRQFVDCVSMPCCVLSVEKTEEAYGEIRIVCANEAYRATMGESYYDGMIYSELVPKDNKFEDYCYRAAVLGQKMHAYVVTKALGFWTDQTLVPLQSDRKDIGYCQFIFEFTRDAETDRMAAVSIETARPVIRACIELMRAGDFHASVGGALDVIIREAGAGAARILLIDHMEKSVVHYCDRIVDGRFQHRTKDPLSYELVRSWEQTIGVSDCIIIKDEQDLAELERENPAWARSMREDGVESLVLVPMRRGESAFGYLYMLNFNVDNIVRIKEMLSLMSFFLGSEIYNHILLGRMEKISLIDELTGVFNRRAMSRRMGQLAAAAPGRSFGVVNIDLNGLKTVNDRDGHDAGDRLIAQAARLLEDLFRRDDIFRTGGDEFIVIADDTDSKGFTEKLCRLREDAEKGGVRFAVGSFWSDGGVPLKDVFRCADEMMYADKNAYYARHPELKRR